MDGSAEDQGEAIDPEVVECTERIAISYALATFLSQPYASAFLVGDEVHAGVTSYFSSAGKGGSSETNPSFTSSCSSSPL